MSFKNLAYLAFENEYLRKIFNLLNCFLDLIGRESFLTHT